MIPVHSTAEVKNNEVSILDPVPRCTCMRKGASPPTCHNRFECISFATISPVEVCDLRSNIKFCNARPNEVPHLFQNPLGNRHSRLNEANLRIFLYLGQFLHHAFNRKKACSRQTFFESSELLVGKVFRFEPNPRAVPQRK